MNEREIFVAALKKRSLAERAAYLDSACGDDREMRRQVEDLLARNEKLESFLESPAADDVTLTVTKTIDGGVGQQIGPYKLREKLGEGGMGVVYAAEQEQPVRRKVALKIIKPGMDSREVISRFEAERQALAMMDHQNIARVLDAGTTESGLPYFVMELVRGVTVTDYCDKNKLSIRDRLELFTQICKAVQHAHQKGIIHRDIKPSNVMITLHDGVPVPKVIDFGVAKAINQRLTEGTVYTKVAQMLGTPAYMSPEQAELSGLDIDTRSDIYSLGVMLYELLTGSTPFTKEQLSNASFDEMRRVIREDQPPRPSDRVSTLKAEMISTVSGRNETSPERLSSQLKGELDWIVMKALEKDRTRRYDTANDLADDIQRCLSDEPVIACPPSTMYRIQKFAKRNRLQLVATAAIALVLILGLIGTSYGMFQALSAKKLADKRLQDTKIALANEKVAKADAQAAAEREKAARVEEQRQRKSAESIADFVIYDFLALTSVSGQVRFDDFNKTKLNKDSTLSDLLDRATEKLESRPDFDPEIDAHLHWIVGLSHREIGNFERSIELLEKSVQLSRDAYGEDSKDTISAINSLAVAYSSDGQLRKAIPLFQQALDWMQSNRAGEDENTLEVMTNLASAFGDDGQGEKQIALLEQAQELAETEFGPAHELSLRISSQLARAYMFTGQQTAKAIPLAERVVRLAEVEIGLENPLFLVFNRDLANCYRQIGALSKAMPCYEKTLALSKSVLGPEHPETANLMNELGLVYLNVGRRDEGTLLLEQSLELRKSQLGMEHPATLNSMQNLAFLHWGNNQLGKSIPIFEEVSQRLEQKLGPDHPLTLKVIANLGVNYMSAGMLDKAIPLLEKVNRSARDYPVQLWFAPTQLIDAYVKNGQINKAEELVPEYLTQVREKLPNKKIASILICLARDLYFPTEQFDKAEEVLRESLLIHNQENPDYRRKHSIEFRLGIALLAQNKIDEAEKLLSQGFDGMTQQRNLYSDPRSMNIVCELIAEVSHLYDGLHDENASEGYDERSAQWRANLKEFQDPDRPEETK